MYNFHFSCTNLLKKQLIWGKWHPFTEVTPEWLKKRKDGKKSLMPGSKQNGTGWSISTANGKEGDQLRVSDRSGPQADAGQGFGEGKSVHVSVHLGCRYYTAHTKKTY